MKRSYKDLSRLRQDLPTNSKNRQGCGNISQQTARTANEPSLTLESINDSLRSKNYNFVPEEETTQTSLKLI
jgi:hypothetical protein